MRHYTVQHGDSPHSIARQFGTPVHQLFAANPHKPLMDVGGQRTWHALRPGERLRVPHPGEYGAQLQPPQAPYWQQQQQQAWQAPQVPYGQQAPQQQWQPPPPVQQWQPPSPSPMQRLGTNQALNRGESITNQDGSASLTMQHDGDLVLRASNPRHVLWRSGTAGRHGHNAWMDGDGNLRVTDSARNVLWDNGAHGHHNAHAKVEPDGNLVVWSGSHHQVWDAGANLSQPNPVPGGHGAAHGGSGSLYPGVSLGIGDVLAGHRYEEEQRHILRGRRDNSYGGFPYGVAETGLGDPASDAVNALLQAGDPCDPNNVGLVCAVQAALGVGVDGKWGAGTAQKAQALVPGVPGACSPRPAWWAPAGQSNCTGPLQVPTITVPGTLPPPAMPAMPPPAPTMPPGNPLPPPPPPDVLAMASLDPCNASNVAAVCAAQAALGLKPDGKWGAGTAKAASAVMPNAPPACAPRPGWWAPAGRTNCGGAAANARARPARARGRVPPPPPGAAPVIPGTAPG